MSKQDRDRPTRLGVIGTGLAVEKLHWPAIQKLGGAYHIVAFCDQNRDAAAHFSSYVGAPMSRYTNDRQDLLRRDDVEAVLVALPIPLLYEAAREALQAGKHVICEKPAGVDEPQAHAFLCLAAEFPNLHVLIAENIFYRDDLRVARSLLDAGAIGRIHLMVWRSVGRNVPRPGEFSGTQWRQHTQYRGGAQLDAGVHHLAQIRLLCGDPLTAHGDVQWANSTIDGPSDLTLNLRFVSGAIGNYTAAYPEIEVPLEPNEMRIYGTEGILTLSGDHHRLIIALHRPDGEGQRHLFTGIDGGHYGELRNFREALVDGAPVVGTIEQSVKNLLVIERGLDSAEHGIVVSFEDAPNGLSEHSVPLWKPHGTNDLRAGFPGDHEVDRIGG